MERFFSLIVGTISTVLFIVMLLKGKKYSYLLENLSDKEFPLHEFYQVGFAWCDSCKILSFENGKGTKLKKDTNILYGEKFSEFYARIYLAQAYTYAHLTICFATVLAGMVDGFSSILLLLFGFGAGIALALNALKAPREQVEKRADNCLIDFPDMVTKLALMIHSGMILRDAWFLITKSSEGQLKELMQNACELMENGKSDIDAIYMFGIHSGSKEIKKFSSSVIQGIEKGNAELATMLMQQSSELWEMKRQKMLQMGEVAATKLVIPTSLMFAGLLLIIISSAIGGLSI